MVPKLTDDGELLSIMCTLTLRWLWYNVNFLLIFRFVWGSEHGEGS